MPELPEVDRMVDIVSPFCDWTILDVSVHRGDKYLPGTEQNDLFGARILEVYRRGKYMIWNTRQGILVCHNAMSGYWDTAEDPWTFDYVEGRREANDRDVRVELIIAPPHVCGSNLTRTLRFHDARLFGSLRLYQGDLGEVPRLTKMGPEAINTKNTLPGAKIATKEDWWSLGNYKHPIKAVLMDQNRIAGLGNIYAAEACWAARIDPRRGANTLTIAQLGTLGYCAQVVLQRAIERKLDYNDLKIYRREICPECKTPVLREDVKGRSTYFCPKCQR